MSRLNFYYSRPVYHITEAFQEFVDSHNINLWDTKYNSIEHEYAIQLLEHLGYNIEVTEISTAYGGETKDAGTWFRTHTYRWDIIYWKNDAFVKHEISDYARKHPFISRELATADAINYIAENYKEIENVG